MEATADTTSKFLNTTNGRDKLYRFVQFYSRFLSWYLQRVNAPKDAIESYARLSAAVAQTRKLLQFGKQLELLRGIQKAFTIKDEIIKSTTIAKNFCMAIWLSYDFLQWIHSVGFIKFDKIKEISKRAFQFWLAAIAISLVGTAHKLRMNTIKLEMQSKFIQAAKSDEKISPKEVDESKSVVRSLRAERITLAMATVQDLLDGLIPLSAMDYLAIEPGFVGLAGAITSILGAYTQWNSL
ncbi:Peroxisomal membrane protein PMP27 [Nowakowskiella sp. JEL0407]|nr:Peroxisomal membrane protein PMP27 [Nowakowskiella sp. JEL0407]